MYQTTRWFILLMGLLIGAFNQANAKLPQAIVEEIINDPYLVKKAFSEVVNLGLNCALEYETLKSELRKALRGLGEVVSEASLALANKKDYPSICHVMTNDHIKANKKTMDKNRLDKQQRCFEKDLFGTCLLKGSITREVLTPTYYWPKYFIEVTQRGNDFHPAFSKNNQFFRLNRDIAKTLPVDRTAALGAYSLLTASLFKGVGIEMGDVDQDSLLKALSLTHFERNRQRANQSKTGSSYDVNIWPVGLSSVMAEKFSVCGPYLKEQGKPPGGYSWPIKGVPMTCPVAMSSDAMAYWDTGVLDYIDPVSLAKMVTASNLAGCSASAAMDQFGALEGIDQHKDVNKSIVPKTRTLPEKLNQGIQNCSWPILGNKEAILKKGLTIASKEALKGPVCSSWGSIYPRNGTSTYNNDYAFANAGLKFKLLAHELFSLPRGSKERWSLAYPWDGRGSSNSSDRVIEPVIKAFEKIIPGEGALNRSSKLYKPGDPRLIDLSFTKKFLQDRINPLEGNRRIYTVWENVDCEVSSSRTTIKAAGIIDIESYDNCKAAIRFRVYAFLQNELFRQICDYLGQNPGKPWL